MKNIIVLSLFLCFLGQIESRRPHSGSNSNYHSSNSRSCTSSNCRYDQNLAEYCCNYSYSSSCCQYVNNGNGGSGYYPGYPGSGSGYNKPGSCPYNGYGRKKRESKTSYGNSNRYRPPYGGQSRCYNDSDCSGSLKCCQGYNNERTCQYPTYYGSPNNSKAKIVYCRAVLNYCIIFVIVSLFMF